MDDKPIADKELRIPVRLTTEDGQPIPIQGLVLIPAERLKCLENLATLVRDFAFYRNENAKGLGYTVPIADTYHHMQEQLDALEKLWNIPPRKPLSGEMQNS